MTRTILLTVAVLTVTGAADAQTKPAKFSREAAIAQLIAQTKPLPAPRGVRMPVLGYLVRDLDPDAQGTEKVVQQLADRGIGVVMSWSYDADAKKLDAQVQRNAKLASMLKKAGLPVCVDATNVTGFAGTVMNGKPGTGHVGDDGKEFFDTTQISWAKIGCGYKMEPNIKDLRQRVEKVAAAYKAAGVTPDFVYADWEVDGPLDVNDGWQAAKKCKICRQKLAKIDDYTEYQKAMRTLRADMQKRAYAQPMREAFGEVLVGNYGLYPNDGYRYWYDFYEYPVEHIPAKTEGKARYRQWFQEWDGCGYTFAMPVVYPRHHMYQWYDYKNDDFRWFRGMLLNASNAPKARQQRHPRSEAAVGRAYLIISFVKCYVTDTPKNAKSVPPLSEAKYQELLWHMLLRGHDGLFNWAPDEEGVRENVLLQQVFAASVEYNEFFLDGTPVVFDTPDKIGPVVSGVLLGKKVLVRRTDFDDSKEPLKLKIEGTEISVPRADGKCQIIELK